MNLALMIPGREQCPYSLRMLTGFFGICFWNKFWRLMDMEFGTITYLWDLSQVTQPLNGSSIYLFIFKGLALLTSEGCWRIRL